MVSGCPRSTREPRRLRVGHLHLSRPLPAPKDVTSRYLIPLLFVTLWSTGFIAAKYGLPAAEPFTFLGVRMLIVVLALGVLIPLFRVRWPGRPRDYLHIAVVGVLVHGVYLGGVFSAIYRGVDAGLSALIVGLQPLVTVLLSAVWLREDLGRLKMLGMFIGLAGITIVIGERGIGISGVSATGLGLCVASLLAISYGTLYQKRFCTDFDLLPGVLVQYVAAGVFYWVLAFTLESRDIYWSPRFVLALGWLVLVLSLGAVLLLMWLIRHGEAGRVASLFYLVPPLVAVEAWLLFGERLSAVAVGGIALCVLGVAMVMKSPGRT